MSSKDKKQQKEPNLLEESQLTWSGLILQLLGVVGALFMVAWQLEAHGKLTADLAQVTNRTIQFEQFWNDAVPIFNENKFKLEENYIPLVFYVHSRPEYFKEAISALRKVKGIEKTLLIVSQDGYHNELAKLIHTIDFCQVKHLIHPTSPIHEANGKALQNHWMWIQDTMWNKLFPSSLFKRDIAFFEEDHVISPDSYETLKIMLEMKNRGVVRNSTTVALGSYNTDAKAKSSSFVTYPAFYNTGYAFNRTLWESILKYKPQFDAGDEDGDWDSCLVNGLMDPGLVGNYQITPHLSRVKNIGAEGLHKTQTYYELQKEGKHPVASSVNTDWSQLELTLLSHDNSVYQIQKQGPPKKTPVCSAENCLPKAVLQKLIS